MSFLDDDIAATFSSTSPGITTATITLGGVGSTVYGYFDRGGRVLLDAQNVPVISSDPTLHVTTASITGLDKRTDTVTISAVAYNVKGIELVGDGLETMLILGRD